MDNLYEYGSYYTIKKGDTLYRIAKDNNIELEMLMKANKGIDPYNLMIGQVIFVPMYDKKCPYGKIYKVKKGDNYVVIMEKYDLSLQDLERANPGFSLEDIYEGQEICIPSDRTGLVCKRVYTVEEGDNLVNIAEKFVVSVADLLRYNSITAPSQFKIPGIKICIPEEEAPV